MIDKNGIIQEYSQQALEYIIEKHDGSIFAIGFSGGKDSAATLIYITKVLCIPNVVACFADTGWEADETYTYLDYIEQATGVPIIRLQAKCGQVFKKDNPRVPDKEKPMDMLELCKIKGRFPSSQRRFCTTELKLKPMQQWIAEQVKPVVNISGIRREESPKRSSAPFYIEKDEFLSVPVWLPIVAWKWQDVFDMHRLYGVEPNPLYKRGHARVGCYPCIMSNKNELCNIAKNHPEVFDKMNSMEEEVCKMSKSGCSSFFPADTTSAAYRKSCDANSNTYYARAYDVKDWALGKSADSETMDMFAEDDFEDITGPSCNSIYGLCE